MKIIAIVAASENNVIGIDNDMPWRLPDDFKFFKKATMGYPMLMGKNTWISIGAKPLPGREHLIVSSSLKLEMEQVYIFSSTAEAVQYAKDQGSDKLFIIGGGSIYTQLLDITDEILLTRIHTEVSNGQVFFPEIRNEQWEKVSATFHPQDSKHLYDFTFERWIKKQ